MMDPSDLEEVLSNLDASSGSQGASPSSFEEVADGSGSAPLSEPPPVAPSANIQVATQSSTNHQGGPGHINEPNRSDQPALLTMQSRGLADNQTSGDQASGNPAGVAIFSMI